MSASGWILGLHLLSVHAQPGYELATPGFYAVAPHGATLGLMRNSEGRASAYAGLTMRRGDLALTVGAITGYQRARVLPLVVPSVQLGAGARLSLVPNAFGAWALHLSLERGF